MPRPCVSELMHSCESAVIRPDSTLRDAAERVLLTGLESLPVVDDSGSFVGLVVQSALIRQLLNSHSSDETVASIISHHVESARCTASLDGVLPLFRSAGTAMVPVVDTDNCPVGLVHRRDIIRYLMEDTTGSLAHDAPSTDVTGGPHFLHERRKKPTDH